MTPTVKSKIEWIDIQNPKQAELNNLKKKFHLHDVILKELEGPSARSHVERYDDYLYFVFYFPVYDEKNAVSHQAEIDFIVNKSAVVTVHYENLTALEAFRNTRAQGSLDFVYELIQALFTFQERQLVHVREKIELIGNELFKSHERQVLEQVSYLKRDMSEYRIVMSHQGAILNSLAQNGVTFWGEGARIYLNDLVGDHLKVANRLTSYYETLSDFEDTNNQLMNVKATEVMKTFTVLAFFTFPPMLLAALFGMNTEGMPFAGVPYGFWIVVAIMAAAMLTMYSYFKRKGWL